MPRPGASRRVAAIRSTNGSRTSGSAAGEQQVEVVDDQETGVHALRQALPGVGDAQAAGRAGTPATSTRVARRVVRPDPGAPTTNSGPSLPRIPAHRRLALLVRQVGEAEPDRAVVALPIGERQQSVRSIRSGSGSSQGRGVSTPAGWRPESESQSAESASATWISRGGPPSTSRARPRSSGLSPAAASVPITAMLSARSVTRSDTRSVDVGEHRVPDHPGRALAAQDEVETQRAPRAARSAKTA